MCDSEITQARVIYALPAECPECSHKTQLDVTTEDDGNKQVVVCEACGADFVVSVTFEARTVSYALRRAYRRGRTVREPNALLGEA